MNWNNIKITIFKELRGIIRDKKSIQKIILYPLLIPIVILMFGMLFDNVNESNYNIGVNYQLSEDEKNIIDEIDNITIKQYSNKEQLDEAYKSKEIDGYIIKDNNIYTIYADESQNSGTIVSEVSNSYLETYNKILGNNYLLNKGIDSALVFNNIVINSKSLKVKQSNMLTTMMFSLVISYIIMIVVLVCVVVVCDATSGEKERGTLETILTFPIKSSELVIGKYLATIILGFIVGLISYILSVPSFYIGKKLFKSYQEIVFTTNLTAIFLVIFVIFLVSIISAGICMVLAGKSKTYKEAQSSLQFITILPMISYFCEIMEKDSVILNFIPIANCSVALNDIIINTINYHSLIVIILTTIIYTIAILIYISEQYKSEETLF